MRPSSLLRTASFRLAALYAAIFALSVAILFGVVYFIATRALEEQLRTAVRQEAASLAEAYRGGGLEAMLRAVSDRPRSRRFRPPYFALADASGTRLGGNLPEGLPMPEPGRASFEIRPTRDDAEEDARDHDTIRIEAYCLRFDDGSRLAVGEDSQRIDETQEAMLRAMGWGGAAALLLAATGGVLLSLGFLRRIEAINRAVMAIMDGNLSERIPTLETDDDLNRLAVNFNAMLDRIQGLMENLQQVSNDIAHDLRKPLSHLRQKLETARRTARDAGDYQERVDQAIAEVDDILRTFSAILRIAQIESGGRRAAFVTVDLSALAQFLAESYGPVAEDRGQRLEPHIEKGLFVTGDRDLLAQMLVNLLENAIRHCPEGTRVDLSLERSGNEAILSVADNGPGIAEAERAKVFRRFYRTDQSRAATGSGLGLALVKAVAELHKTEVTLSDNHPGLRASLRLPLQRAEP